MQSKSSSKHDQVRDEDRAIVRRLFERVYSTGDLSLVDELVASDFVGDSTESSEAYLGPEGMKSHVSRLRGVFYGFTIEIDDLHVEDDTFEVSWIARGTHERRFLGIEPTVNVGQAGDEPHGNRIAVSGVATGTLTNGEIRENRIIWDEETLRRQLGGSVEGADDDTGSPESNGQERPLLEREET